MSLNAQAQDWLFNFRSQVNVPTRMNTFSHQPKTFSVTGGKGGVGKTSIALKLAIELSAASARVLLIDFDYNLSNTGIKLGLPFGPTLAQLLRGEVSLKQAIIRGPKFDLLSGGNGDLDLFERHEHHFERFIIDIVHQVEKEYDVIIFDCPAGLGREALSLNAYSDYRIMIVAPDRSSITDAYAMMKILKHKFGVSSNLLLANKIESTDQYLRLVKSLTETAENFLDVQLSILGMISKVEVSHSNFDHFFLFDQTSKTHHDFTKVLAVLTEKCLDGRDSSKSRPAQMQEATVTGCYR